MKKILGLDLGTTSIGWAIVEATDEKKENPITGEKSKTDINNDRIGIHEDAVGVRIIPADEMQRRFNEGKKLNDGEKHTPTADRRIKRSSRRANSRYKLRRDKLLAVLEYLKLKPVGSFVKNGKGGWIDDRTNGKLYSKEKEYVLNSKGQQIHKRQPDDDGDTDIGKQLYKLRDRAIREKIELEELGRILLLLNQWRGYSSDRFTKDEKSNFDYYTATVVELDENPVDIVYEDKEKTKLKWNQYAVSLQFTDPIKDESDNLISNLTGFHFCQKLKFKIGDIISFKYEKKETKVKKVVVNQYFKINLVNPNPEDWNFRYQNLNKTLTEWCNEGGSVGSYFYQNFYVEKNIDRIRTNVVNRNWYENELKKIFKKQYAEHREYFQQFDIDSVLEVAFKDKNIHSKVKNTQPEEGEDPLEAKLRCLISECIIYFQRPWQQAKNKGACRFEKIKVWKERVKKGTQEKERFETYEGRTVVPRSHPLHQEFKVWQQINNVRLFYIKDGKVTNLFDENNADLLKQLVGKDTTEIKLLLYGELQQKKSLSWISFIEKTLNISVFVEGLKAKTKYQEVPTEYFTVNYIKRTKKGELQENLLKGNNTKACLKTILKEKTDEWFDEIAKTGTDDHQNIEVVEKYSYKTCEYKISNLQLLWELIYDITESKSEKVAQNIKKNFPDFTNETCDSLSNINFDDSGMAQLSAKAIRKLLPLMKVYQQDEVAEYPQKVLEKIIHLLDQNKNDLNNETPEEERLESLRDLITDTNARKRLSKFVDIKQFVGLNYWESAAVIYGQHAKHGEQSENIKKDIEKLFEPVKRNSVNNPVVEKIVNETISLCKEIYQRYGFDEVRIELSRELKASREEREQMWESMNEGNIRNDLAKRMLRELFNAETSNNNITKLRIYSDEAKYMSEEVFNELTKSGEIIKKDGNEEAYKFKKFEEINRECNLKEPSKADILKYKLWLDQMYQCPYTGEIIKLSDIFTSKYEIEHIIPKERYFDNSYGNKVITRKVINGWKSNQTAFEFITSNSGKTIIDSIDNKQLTILSWDGKSDTDNYPTLVKRLFPKGRKQMNLLRKTISDDPLSRQLKETQYISVLVKEKLGKVIGVDKVWTTSGAITDMLRQSWHLNDVMKELMRD
ncbi:MAG TPA: HNH endonuclease domain-containing protein, partial [Paludibacter sp.]|nr:HNH endonuclease domain-containing protein [Paludibacter sp.]